MYLEFTVGDNPLRTAYSLDTTPLAASWPVGGGPGSPQSVSANPSGSTGLGAMPLVIQAGPAAGRLILGWSDRWHPPSIAYSDTGGDDIQDPSQPRWHSAQSLSGWTDYTTTPPTTGSVSGVGVHNSPTDPQPVPGNLTVMSVPQLAADPVHPSTVYAVFTGRTSSTGSNLDLFIALSLDGGASFNSGNIVHIADDQLRPAGTGEGESDEYLPSIAIDALGGINLLFLRTTSPDSSSLADTRVTARYARWPGFASLTSGARAFTQDLSDPFVPWGTFSGNDYQMITASGCDVYAGWASDQSGNWEVYVSHIDLYPCYIPVPADVDSNGVVNPADAAAFTNAFIAGTPPADVDHSGTVTTNDATLFLQSYACGCDPR